MEKILLVEPNYKNKYPPIGLMKISTYYKNKGDYVEFHKGLLTSSEVIKFDRVLITTLFTFDFKMCIDAINYYISLVGLENVAIGGIAASIMPKKFQQEIPGINILTGQLTSSNLLGYDDDINIDILELDYDILLDTTYSYPMEDSYFLYASRGCPRKCDFCAVKDLEPNFYNCNNIKEQIMRVNDKYGIRKNLLIMDNNILFSSRLSEVIQEIQDLGFGADNNCARKNNKMKYYLNSLMRRLQTERKVGIVLSKIKDEFLSLKFHRISKQDRIQLEKILKAVTSSNSITAITSLIGNRNYIVTFFGKYNYHKISRYVDFNQGLDARLFTDEKARLLGSLALKPCRIAFDDLNTREEYLTAMNLAVRNKTTYFSNYLLYNYKDDPRDLWIRLYINIQFCKEHPGISLFSFPMKYAAIDMTDRSYVGKSWNRKYLRAMNVILNVTSGVVAKEEDFFLRAFGHNEHEFLDILAMPDEFIRYRDYFESIGLTQLWKKVYAALSSEDKVRLLDILSEMVNNPDILEEKHSDEITQILWFYSIRKKQVELNELYYINQISNWNNNLKPMLASKDVTA